MVRGVVVGLGSLHVVRLESGQIGIAPAELAALAQGRLDPFSQHRSGLLALRLEAAR